MYVHVKEFHNFKFVIGTFGELDRGETTKKEQHIGLFGEIATEYKKPAFEIGDFGEISVPTGNNSVIIGFFGELLAESQKTADNIGDFGQVLIPSKKSSIKIGLFGETD